MVEILDALNAARNEKGRPTMIAANTIKGRGISFAENAVPTTTTK